MQETNPISRIKTYKVIFPTLIGLGVVAYLMFKEFDPSAFSLIQFTKTSIFWLFVAAICMIIRDLGYIWRIRILTHNKLTFIQAVKVIFLWEFTSAITPSAVGGTSVAILYVNKEGINIGQSSAVVMATSFLDEIYFVLMFPLLLLLTNIQELFAAGGGISFANPFFTATVIGYALKISWVFIISYGLFWNPRGLKWFLLFIFKLSFLRRWRSGAAQAGTEIIESSKELKKQSFTFWLKAFLATFFSWTSRYWIVNALFLAFFTVGDHLLLFARQLVMWIMMLVSPTPGGSGFAEYVFSEYLNDFIPLPSVAILLALLWRLLTYYPYLIIGVFLFPKWLKDKFAKTKKKKKKQVINHNFTF